MFSSYDRYNTPPTIPRCMSTGKVIVIKATSAPPGVMRSIGGLPGDPEAVPDETIFCIPMPEEISGFLYAAFYQGSDGTKLQVSFREKGPPDIKGDFDYSQRDVEEERAPAQEASSRQVSLS